MSVNFQSERTKPALLLEIPEETEKNGGEIKYGNQSRIWVTFKNDNKMNIFSQTGKARRNAVFICRYNKRVSTEKIIKYSNRHYFLTDCQQEGNYINISAVEIEPVECQVTEKLYLKDEYNRPVKTEGKRIVFDGFFSEKYKSSQSTDVSFYTDTGLVLITDKKVDLKEGTVVKVSENEAGIEEGYYIIEICHKTNGEHNEYEVQRKNDV